MSTRTFNYDPTEPGTQPDHDSSITANDVGISHAELMAAIDATIKPFDEGDLVAGTVVKIDKDEVLVDIGFKSEGVIPAHELSIKQDVDPSRVVSVGDRVEALVLQKEDKEGRLILSKKRAQYERAWGNIEAIKQAGGIVKGPVIEVVKGGLIVDIGLRGFLPASLVDLRRVRDLHPFVGKVLEWSEQDVFDLMAGLQDERNAFASEEDPLNELLHQWIGYKPRMGPTNIGREVTIHVLYADLNSFAQQQGITWYKNPKILAQKLRSSHIERDFIVQMYATAGRKTYRIWRQTDAQLSVVPDEPPLQLKGTGTDDENED